MQLTELEFALLQKRLKPMLTDEFLATLVEAARTVGNSGDSVAIREFVDDLFDIAGRPLPEHTPYDTDVEAARAALGQL